MTTGIAGGLQRSPALERVSFGRPAAEVLADEADRCAARRVVIVTNRSLAARDDLLAPLRAALGNRLAGVFSGVAAHAPLQGVAAAAAYARSAGADLLVSLGGGSVVDAAKIVLLALWHGAEGPDGIAALQAHNIEDPSLRPPALQDAIRLVAIPTTLSAAEFAWFAGAHDTQNGRKLRFVHPYIVPRAIILDPAMTLATPPRLFLATGIKALDHAVERFCAPDANAISDAPSIQAMALLAAALPQAMRQPLDVAARLDCQLGMWLSMAGGTAGVAAGASHGIGHVLGSLCGLGHGDTSCVMLPAVLAWNAAEDAARQAGVSRAMGQADRPAADLVRDLVAGLGLPTRLSDLGVDADRFAAIAAMAVQDRLVARNPRRIAGPADIEAILRLAA